MFTVKGCFLKILTVTRPSRAQRTKNNAGRQRGEDSRGNVRDYTHAHSRRTERGDRRERATRDPHQCTVRVRLSESRRARRAESHKPRQPTGGDGPIRVVVCATTRHPRIDHMLAHSPFLSYSHVVFSYWKSSLLSFLLPFRCKCW